MTINPQTIKLKGGVSRDPSEGACCCGCGQKTNIAPRTRSSRGYIKGHPMSYVAGHSGRTRPGLNHYTIEHRGYVSACWRWIGFVGRNGYGYATYKGRSGLAHKLWFESIYGPVAHGMELDHLCRNRDCVNPDHVEPVTRRENIRRGSSTKLTPLLVSAIKGTSKDDVSNAAWARALGVNSSNVSNIRHDRGWQDIEPMARSAALDVWATCKAGGVAIERELVTA